MVQGGRGKRKRNKGKKKMKRGCEKEEETRMGKEKRAVTKVYIELRNVVLENKEVPQKKGH